MTQAIPPPPGPPSSGGISTGSKPAIDWRTTHIWHIQPVRDLLVLAAVIGLIYLGYVIRVVTIPLLLALLLAYLFEPVVKKMTARGRVSRPGAVVIIIVLAAVLVVAPVIFGAWLAVAQGARAVSGLAENTNRILTVTSFTLDATRNPRAFRVDDQGPDLERVAGTRFTFRPGPDAAAEERERAVKAAAAYRELRRPWTWIANVTVEAILREAQRVRAPPAAVDGAEAGVAEPVAEPAAPDYEPSILFDALVQGLGWVQAHAQVLATQTFRPGVRAVGAAIATLASIGYIAFTVFLTGFFFFFLSTGWGRVLAFWESLIPERRRGRVFDLLAQMDRVVSGFVRGRLTICAIQSVFYAVGYWIVGVPAPLIVGVLVGVLGLIPYAAMVGIPLAIVLMLLEPAAGARGTWWWALAAPTVIYFLGQALDDYVLSPIIQGKSTNMDTPTILFASIAGGALMGVYGLLLAIPVAACIKVLLREVFWPRFEAWAQGREQDFLPLRKE